VSRCGHVRLRGVAAASARIVTRYPVNRRRVDRIIHMQMRSSEPQIGEVEAKEILRAYDFNVLAGQLPGRGGSGGNRGTAGYPSCSRFHRPTSSTNPISAACASPVERGAGAGRVLDLMMVRIQRRRPTPICAAAMLKRWGNAAAR